MDFVKAFVCGGLICVLTQILMEKTKLMPGRIMVILVTTGVVLGAVGIYEPFVKFAGAGATVPLTGFGNVLWKGMKKAIDEQGFLGLFTGGRPHIVQRVYALVENLGALCCLTFIEVLAIEFPSLIIS